MKFECYKFKRECGGDDKVTGANAGKEDECLICREKGLKKNMRPKAGTKKTGAAKAGNQESNSN